MTETITVGLLSVKFFNLPSYGTKKYFPGLVLVISTAMESFLNSAGISRLSG